MACAQKWGVSPSAVVRGWVIAAAARPEILAKTLYGKLGLRRDASAEELSAAVHSLISEVENEG
jgi:hypothetical protein